MQGSASILSHLRSSFGRLSSDVVYVMTLSKRRSKKRRLYAMMLSFCLSVRLSVAYEIYEVIRYVAAPGGEREPIVSTPILMLTLFLVCNTVSRVVNGVISKRLL